MSNTPLNDALKPCPFCGITPSFEHIEIDANQGYKWGRVRCCIEGPEVRTNYDESENAPWKADAIAAWNTRSNTPGSAAQGAMTVIEKDDLRNILDDLHAGCISANAILTLEDWLRADCLVRPSDATAQPITDERAAFSHELWAVAQLLPNEGIEDGVARIAKLLANTAQGKPRNFCADCGKRTPEGSIHTCAPAYAVDQADHIIDANKMVDDVLGKATSYEETRQLFIELVSALAAKKG